MICATRLPTNTLNLCGFPCNQLSTIVESVHAKVLERFCIGTVSVQLHKVPSVVLLIGVFTITIEVCRLPVESSILRYTTPE